MHQIRMISAIIPKSFRVAKAFYGYHRKKPSQVIKSSGSSVSQVMAAPRGAGDAGRLAVNRAA